MAVFLPAGIGLIILGLILVLVSRSRYVGFCVDARIAVAEKLEASGECSRAKKMREEVTVLKDKLPCYGRILVVAGILVLAVSLVF